MIASLKGTIKVRGTDFVILENQGIGYKILVNPDVLLRFKEGKALELFIHQQVREDSWQLFGFLHYADLRLFELLISVSGVGPKTALKVLSEAEAAAIQEAILRGDPVVLNKVASIGVKTAERIVLELKNKMQTFIGETGVAQSDSLTANADAREALMSLGFSAAEARDALKKVTADVKDTKEMVREALKRLNK